jgi:hypothetical protein
MWPFTKDEAMSNPEHDPKHDPKHDYANYSHPYIVAWGRRIGSSWGYINDQLANARRRKAPKDAWSCHGNEEIKLARDLEDSNMFRGWLESETGITIDAITSAKR